MRKLYRSVAGLVFLGLANMASAAIITLPFTIEVEQLTGAAEAVAIGSRYNGAIRYDDTDLTPNGGNFDIGMSLEIDFAFTRGENFVPPQLVINSASVTAAGALANLDFSVDFPNDLFFSASNLTFRFEFQQGNGDPEEPLVGIIASGRGVFLEPVIAVPAPATALLLLPVAVMLTSRRHRRRS